MRGKRGEEGEDEGGEEGGCLCNFEKVEGCSFVISESKRNVVNFHHGWMEAKIIMLPIF